jgi:hypothetical protein
MGGTLGQVNDNDDVQIKGGTNGTIIGNIGDRLNVRSLSTGQTSSKFRVDFAQPAQVITGASYVSFYSYAGSGIFTGVVVFSNQDGFQLRVLIDGTEVVLTDISGSQMNSAGLSSGVLYRIAAGDIAFFPPNNGIAFSSSIRLLGKRDNAGNVTVETYIVYLTKET